MTYAAATKKFQFERMLMFPFVMLGRICGKLFKLKTDHRVFLFFPSGDIGGSPQVNIDLLTCIQDTKPLVIFSKKPSNNKFRELYNIEGVRVIDLHPYIDYKLFHFINFFFRGVIAAWIDAAKDAVVFGGESLFFYKIVPHVRKSTHCVELCHLDTWLHYSIGMIDHIDLRVFSTENLKRKVEAQYRANNLAEHYFQKLFFTDNAIDIPAVFESKSDKLQVLFMGRGAPQKRVHLATAIAAKSVGSNLPAEFHFVGDVDRVVDPRSFPEAHFYGNVSEQSRIMEFYRKADVLLLTSAFEGLPIVVMQMMAHGKVVLSTAVDAIPDYVKHMENGLLIYSQEESKIVEEGFDHLKTLAEDRTLLKKLGTRSREMAIGKFSRQKFCTTYRRLLKISND